MTSGDGLYRRRVRSCRAGHLAADGCAGFWLRINVFDILSARQGHVFKLAAHVNRFYRSLHAVRITIPFTREEFGQLIVETVRPSSLEDSYVQTIATRGLRTGRANR